MSHSPALVLVAAAAFAALTPLSALRAQAAPTDSTATSASQPAATAAPGDSTAKRASAKLKAAAAKPKAAKAAARAKPPAAPRPVPVWPVKGPAPLPGSILPAKRIIAYYGNPLSKRMGVLGEYKVDRMLAMLDGEVAKWTKADPATPAIPALHLIVMVAQADAGRDGMYRAQMADTLIERVAAWAARRDALLFIDLQVGRSTLQKELPKFEKFLKRPNVHLGVDPEFMMKTGAKPGTKIGSMDAADVNYATEYLANLVTANALPPKVLVIHRFTRGMLTNTDRIRLDPRVQVVIDMDGWGAPWLKRDSYEAYIYRQPVQYAGFKLFYHNDTKKGDPLMSPEDVLRLNPRPVYIQYQ